MADSGRKRGRSQSRSRSRSPRPSFREREREREKPDIKTVDREKTCPLLLRVFFSHGRHNRPDEYSRTGVPSNELQIYTWKDATLKELMSLVKEVNPETRQKGTVFDFATVYPDMRRGGYILKDVGSTTAGRKGPDDNVTLESKKFQIGDYLDINIIVPRGGRDMGRRGRAY